MPEAIISRPVIIKLILPILLLLVVMGGINFLYLKENQDVNKGTADYDLTYRYYVKNQGALNLTHLTARLAIMKTWQPVQKVNNLTISKAPNNTIIDQFDNHYAIYEFDTFDSGKVLDVTFSVNLTLNLLDYSKADLFTKPYDTESEEYLLYTAYNPLADPSDLRIAQTAQKIASESVDLNNLVFNIYNFSSSYLHYRLLSTSRGASFAITNGYGDCDEYQDLLIALSRANNIPAIGHTAWLADFQTGMVTGDDGAVAHAYPMILTPTYGLLPLDPTRGKDQLFDNWLKTDYKRITMTRGPNHPYRLLNYKWVPQDGLPSPDVKSNYTITINNLNIHYDSRIRRVVVTSLFGIPSLFAVISALKFRISRRDQQKKLAALLEPSNGVKTIEGGFD